MDLVFMFGSGLAIVMSIMVYKCYSILRQHFELQKNIECERRMKKLERNEGIICYKFVGEDGKCKEMSG